MSSGAGVAHPGGCVHRRGRPRCADVRNRCAVPTL